MAYCFVEEQWRKISLSFIPTDIAFGIYTFSSAELGLVAFYQDKEGVYVCNPLTNDYGKIQIDWKVWPIKMVQGESDGEPYVVANLKPCDLYESCFGIYHYFQNAWKIKFHFSQRLEFQTYLHLFAGI